MALQISDLYDLNDRLEAIGFSDRAVHFELMPKAFDDLAYDLEAIRREEPKITEVRPLMLEIVFHSHHRKFILTRKEESKP
jgi:hypothetical protein